MPVGILRASEQGAIWRVADGSAFPGEEAKYGPKPSTSTPPSGVSTPDAPEPAPEIVIPNSNKFKYPANNLKKLLDTVDIATDDKAYYGPNAHPKVQDWFDTHAAFHPYVKPQYADAIKATVGPENYEKLLYHMPKEHHEKLTTHTQQPAPNSNKFVLPTNQLKKLLDNPNTTPQHVQAWKDSHEKYVKSYLHNPAYQEAIKGHLGEQNYDDWQEHLHPGKEPAAKPLPQSKADQVAENAAKAFAPAGFVPKSQEQFFTEHGGPEGAAAAQGKTTSLNEDMTAAFPNTPTDWDTLHPEVAKGKLQKSYEHYKTYGTTESDKAAAAKLKKILDKHFAQEPSDQGELTENHKNLIQFTKDNPDWAAQHGETLKSPEFKAWFDAQPEHYQGSSVLSPTKTMQDFDKYNRYGDQEPTDQDVAQPKPSVGAQLKALNPDIVKSSPEKLDSQLEGKSPEQIKSLFDKTIAKYPDMAEGLQKIYDDNFGDQGDIEAIKGQMPAQPELSQSSPEDQAFQAWWGQTNGLTEAEAKKEWAKIPPQGVANWSPGSANYEKYGPGGQPAAPTPAGGEAAQHKALTEAISKVFPNSNIAQAPDEYSVPEIKKQLEDWQTHLDHPEHAESVKAITDLYNQHFGAGAAQPAAPPGSSGYDPQAVSDELKAIYQMSGDPKVHGTPIKDLDAAQAQKALTELSANGTAYSPKIQELLDKHFGAGVQAPDLIRDIKSVFPTVDPLVLADLKTKTPEEQKKYLQELVPQYSKGGQWHDEEQLGQLNKLLDKHFGKPEQPSAPSGAYSTLLGLISSPDFQTWKGQQDPDVLMNMSAGQTVEAYQQWKQQSAPVEENSAHQQNLKDLAKVMSGDEGGSSYVTDVDDYQQWEKGLSPTDAEYFLSHPVTAKEDFEHFLEGHYNDEEQEPEEWEQAHGGDEISPEDEDEIAKMQQQIGGDPWATRAQTQPSSGGAVDVQSLTKELAAALHMDHPDDLHQNGKKWKDKTPEEAKDDLEELLPIYQDDPQGPELQAMYDKYFGGGQQPQQAAPTPFQGGLNFAQELTQAANWSANPAAANHGGVKFRDMTPDQAQAAVKSMIDGYGFTDAKDTLQALYDKYWGGGAPAAPQGGGPTKAWFDAHWPHLADGTTQAAIDQAFKEPSTAIAQAWNGDVYHDKDQYAGGGGAGQPFDFDTFKQSFIDGGWPKDAMGFKGLKDAYDAGGEEGLKTFLHDKVNFGSSSWKHLYQAALDKLNQSSGGGAPPPIPEFDWDQFGPAFKEIYPNSSWAVGSDPGSASAQAKLKAAVDVGNSQYPGQPKTEAANALYEKWFGPVDKPLQQATPSGGGVSAPAYTPPPPPPPPEPEELEGVSAPAKSEQPTPEDLTAWEANKPATPGQWKDFAAWWGKTVLDPEQEQAIYQTWFPNKAVTPEIAANWFQQAYDHYSKPSTGDLTASHQPAWASASWALGTKADKEWPVFQQWANNESGIPANTTIKQKLQIWNGLSATEKKEIADNYLPAHPVDVPSVVGALQQAFPDSDFSKWAAMPQGTLRANVEKLAKSGYDEAIPVFNQFFGGKIPVPEPKPEAAPGDAPAQAFAPKLIPPSALPEWVKNQWGEGEAEAKRYTDLKHFADSINAGPLVEQDYSSANGIRQIWENLLPHLRAQITAMPTPPWTDKDGFTAWKDAQPTLIDKLKEVYPEQDWDASYGGPGSPFKNPNVSGITLKKQHGALGKLIEQEVDPHKKQALLGLYHQFFGNGKTTLAQSLNAIYPEGPGGKVKDWDTFLQNSPTAKVASELKKRLKNEADPEKWIQLADTWAKYFPHPENPGYKIAPTGIKQLTEVLKNAYPGNGLSADTLKSLKHWKEKNDPSADVTYHYYLPDDYDPGPYVNAKKATSDPGGYPGYHGWTPSGLAAGEGFKSDPAMLGSTPKKTYVAPATEQGTTTQYKELKETAQKGAASVWNSGQFMEEYKKSLPQVVQQLKDIKKDHPEFSGGGILQKTPTPEQAKAELAQVLQHPEGLEFWQQQRLENLWDKYFTDTGFSAKDKDTLGSDGFRQWFDGAPPKYREVMKLHPGQAIDDYRGFLHGEPFYPSVPEGSGKKTHYDLTPYHFLPYTEKSDPKHVHFGPNQKMPFSTQDVATGVSKHPAKPTWPGFTKNPMRPGDRQKEVKWPEVQEVPGQQELILGPGETMEPGRKPLELHRGIKIELGDYNHPISKSLMKSDPGEYYRELHRKWLMDNIRARWFGTQGKPGNEKDQDPDLFTDAGDDTDKSKFQKVPKEWEDYGPPKNATGQLDFAQWAIKNGVSPEQMYALGKKWGADDPNKYGPAPLSEGPWTKGLKDSPEGAETEESFTNLLLDYVEASDYRGSQGSAPPGSIGDHWSLNSGTAQSFGGGNSSGNFPSNSLTVKVTGDWSGQGEWPNDPYDVVSFGSEKELPLAPGAPIRVKRVRVTNPGHPHWKDRDVKVTPHIRHAAMSVVELIEDRIGRLASAESLTQIEARIERLAEGLDGMRTRTSSLAPRRVAAAGYLESGNEIPDAPGEHPDQFWGHRGCGALALAFVNKWPDLHVGVEWEKHPMLPNLKRGDSVNHAWVYDDNGRSHDYQGTHQEPVPPLHTTPGHGEVELGVDPAVLAHKMGHDWSPDDPWADEDVSRADDAINGHWLSGNQRTSSLAPRRVAARPTFKEYADKRWPGLLQTGDAEEIQAMRQGMGDDQFGQYVTDYNHAMMGWGESPKRSEFLDPEPVRKRGGILTVQERCL